MRTHALLCPLILGSLSGLTGCLEAQSGSQDQDAKGATRPLDTRAPPDTVTPRDTSTRVDEVVSEDIRVGTTDPSDTGTPPDGGPADVDTPPDTTPTCQVEGGDCYRGETCCEGTICQYDPNRYGLAICTRPAPNGSPCPANESCQSGHCIDGICSEAPKCLAETQMCMGQNDCCAGLVCTGGPYIYGECIHKRPLHAYCESERWCESGICQDSRCVSAGCLENGAGCMEGECCSGLCHYPGNSYAPPTCIAPQPVGAPCEGDGMCDSGICTDGTCGPKSCGTLGDECYFDGGCCAGEFCTNNGTSYVAGECLGKRDLGGWCDFDTWCRSGHCTDGTCTP